MEENFSWGFTTMNAAKPTATILRRGSVLLILQPADHKYGVVADENILQPLIPSVISSNDKPDERVESTTGYMLKPNEEVAKMFRARMLNGAGTLTITSETDGMTSTVEIKVL